MDIIKNGTITSPAGFKAAGAAAEIKYKGRMDMAMIYSDSPCTVAGCFTRNVVKAAPVIWDRDIVRAGGKVRAIVANSGIANACTGSEGMRICRAAASKTGEVLGINENEVLLGSTGVIGMQIPEDRISAGIELLAGNLSDGEQAGHDAERAIMTTDTVPKEYAVSFDQSDGTRVTIGGISKGSGMIHPNMCTMLSYVTTDADISRELLQEALCSIVDETFNMISVDGDTSTNDTILVLANGASGARAISEKNADYDLFYEGLMLICRELAKGMAADGEGATKLVEAIVAGADSKENARTLAKSVVCSSLTKAAMYGNDANWGRILCALGYSGASFDPEKVRLSFRDPEDGKEILIYENGSGTDYSEEEATALLSKKHVQVMINMNMGDVSATAYGCDLTHEYVNINADYRS